MSNSIQLNIDVVDAFSESQFSGNSAAVIVLDDWLSNAIMLSIAAENNLSETAFLVLNDRGAYDIRWFSPLTEIDFCGHATLASAFVLFNKNKALQQLTLSAAAVGDMLITKQDSGVIEMDFPNRKPEHVDVIPEQLLSGLSIKPSRVLKNGQAYFAIYDHTDDVINVTQNTDIIKQLAPLDVVVSAAIDKSQNHPLKQYDFASRYFWPANGGEEDPVTGSIHTGLAPFWASELNKDTLVAYQASARGGVLTCRVAPERVYISGNAQHYLSGVITLNIN